MKIVPVHQAILDEVTQLADSIFRAPDQGSMSKAFPQLFSDHWGHSIAASEDERIVAFMGLAPTTVAIGGSRINLFSMGSVCTHPDYRGKGFADQMIMEVRRYLEKSEASMMLVSGTRSLYTRNQCIPFGSIQRFTMNADQAQAVVNRADSHIQIRDLEPSDWLAIHRLDCTKYSRFEHSVWELAELVHNEAYASCVKLRHRTIVAQKNGRIIAAAVFSIPDHRQQRRPSFAVEWFGDTNAITILCAQIVIEEQIDALEIPVTWYEQALQNELKQVSIPSSEEKNLGTVYIVQAERLITELQSYLIEKDQDLAAKLTVTTNADRQISIQIGSIEVTLTQEQFVSLIFDPIPHSEIDSRLLQACKHVFPIPFPNVAGLNYI